MVVFLFIHCHYCLCYICCYPIKQVEICQYSESDFVFDSFSSPNKYIEWFTIFLSSPLRFNRMQWWYCGEQRAKADLMIWFRFYTILGWIMSVCPCHLMLFLVMHEQIGLSLRMIQWLCVLYLSTIHISKSLWSTSISIYVYRVIIYV